MKLRVGIVGIGESWEQRHRPSLRALSDRFEVRAICDEVTQRALQAAREFDATVVDGYHALAARDDIDVLLLGNSSWYGWLPIFAACDSRKAVFCDTSLVVRADDSQQLKRRIDESGIAFVAEFPRRFSPATLRLKELIATRLGAVQLIFCHHRLTSPPTMLAGPGGIDTALLSQRILVELVDWCCYVVGAEPASVLGVVDQPGSHPGSGYEMLSLQFQGEQGRPSPVAQISCGRYLPKAWGEAISFRPLSALQVCCEHGVAFIDLPSTLTWFDDAGRHLESLDSDRPVGQQLLLHFHRSVTSLVRQRADLEEAYRSLGIVQAARASCTRGERSPWGK